MRELLCAARGAMYRSGEQDKISLLSQKTVCLVVPVTHTRSVTSYRTSVTVAEVIFFCYQFSVLRIVDTLVNRETETQTVQSSNTESSEKAFWLGFFSLSHAIFKRATHQTKRFATVLAHWEGRKRRLLWIPDWVFIHITYI